MPVGAQLPSSGNVKEIPITFFFFLFQSCQVILKQWCEEVHMVQRWQEAAGGNEDINHGEQVAGL